MRLALSLVCLSVWSCAPEAMEEDALPFAEASAMAAPDPSKPGPYQVGVRTVDFVDTRRLNADGSARTLKTEIWYPAVQRVAGQAGVEYHVDEYLTEAQRQMLGEDAIPVLHTTAVRDAAPAATHGPFPLIVFSHGQAAMRYQSTYYTVLLASHGYVVVSPDHQGGTLADVVRNQLQDVTVGVTTRPVDVQFLISKMDRLPSEDPLFGLVDLSRVGVTGHSFGALTSLRVAVMDARVKAIVPQAPTATDIAWLGINPTPDHLDIPVMVQAAHEDQTLPWDDNIAPSLPHFVHPFWLLDVVHGGHFTFSDICSFDLATLATRITFDIPGGDVTKVLSDGCGPTAPPASVAQPLIDHFAVGFFNAQLKGSTGSLELLTQAQADALAGAGTAVLTTK